MSRRENVRRNDKTAVRHVPALGLPIKVALLICGITSFSIENHFPAMLGSNVVKPVKFPPGRERLFINPEPIGSPILTNTIGI